MQANKAKKELNSCLSLRVDQRKSPKYKFDVTPKNYQCFIRKQSSKQDKKKISKLKSNSNSSAKGNEQKYGREISKEKLSKKNEEIKDSVQQIVICPKKKQLSNSPDLAKSSMNEIIYKIEKEGIRSEWKEDELKKIQENHQESQLFFPAEQKIWLNTTNLSLIQEVQKSFISTEQTILSQTSQHYYNNNSYINYSNIIMPFQHHFSLNNSFSYTQESIYSPQYYNMIQKNEVAAKRLFQINFPMIEKDGRTTVMIKNIPNKYSLKLISQEIDEKHANSYDFLYLPFDFNNNCNVGYAFINFLHASYLKEFYLEFNHKKWSKFRSEKVQHQIIVDLCINICSFTRQKQFDRSFSQFESTESKIKEIPTNNKRNVKNIRLVIKTKKTESIKMIFIFSIQQIQQIQFQNRQLTQE